MNGRGMYHTIFFDVGGTLLRAHPSIGGIYVEVAAKYGIVADAEEVELKARKRFLEMLERGRARGWTPHTLSLDAARAWWREVVRSAFGGAADSPRFEAFYQAVFREFTLPERYRLFPEAAAVIEDLLAAGYRLGIISNWDERLRSILDGLNLTRWFDTVVISCDAGVEKPQRGIFNLARERALAGREAEGTRFLHVGDSPTDDFEGALAAGFDARLVNRGAGVDLRSAVGDLLPS
jgi:putative hydrolase of the HAD superfamily